MRNLIAQDRRNREQLGTNLRLGLVQLFTKLKDKVEEVGQRSKEE